MKKLHLFITVLLLVSAIVVARVQTVYSIVGGQATNDNVSLSVPEELVFGEEFVVSIALDNAKEDYTAFVMDLTAPVGFSFVQEQNNDGEMDYVYALNADRKMSDHQMSCNYFPKSNTLRLACFSSTNKTFKGTTGEIVTVKLRAVDSVQGNYNLKLSNVAFTDVSTTDYDFGDVVASVRVYEPLPEGSDFEPDRVYYLYNAGAHHYYGTTSLMASLSSQPLYVKFAPVENAEGVYKLQNFVDNTWKLSYFPDDNNIYIDGVSPSDYGWQIKKVGDYYRLQAAANQATNPNYNTINNPNTYVGSNVNYSAYGIFPFLSEGEDHQIDWILVNVESSELSDWTSTNHEDGSTSTYSWVLNNTETTILQFDWQVSSESGCDRLTITLDGTQLIQASGEQSGSYKEDRLPAGGHILTATYSKDGSVNSGSDIGCVTNISCMSLETLIETYINNVLNAASDNKFLDSVIYEEALAYIEQVRNKQYGDDDLEEVLAKLEEYANRLACLHLNIHVAEAGTMGDLILEKVENFSDVQSLCVSGKLNSSDVENFKSRLTNVQYMDLGETNLTYIPDETFYNHSILRTLVLPKTLKTIGNRAFNGCVLLSQVTFSEALNSIGEYCFYNCPIETLVLPEGLTTIGYGAFKSNNNYTYVYDENGNYMRDENGNYLRVYTSRLKSVSLPSTLTSMGTEVFQYQRYLKTVTFADGLTTIPSYAFSDCQALDSLRLPATLKRINSYAFNNCTSLKSISLPEGIEMLEYHAFSNCSSLTEVVLPTTLHYVYSSFYSCQNLSRMTCNAIIPPYADNDIMGGYESNCTLTVPNLSLNVYKQTARWDQFKIVGSDIMPQDIVITDTYRLNWPDSVSQSYKPNVTLTMFDRGSNYSSSSRYRYGAVTVTGQATLSAATFSQYYDFWNQYQNSSRAYNFATLLNLGTIRADSVVTHIRLYADRWNFICLPFDAKVGDIVVNEDYPYVIRKYDGQLRANGQMDSTWVNITADSTLHAGEGYIWQAASHQGLYDDGSSYTIYERNFSVPALQTINKNNIFVKDNVEVPLAEYQSEFPQNRSWNLIGNPYPCYFDTRAIDATAPITVWNVNYGSYSAYSPVDDEYILTPGEAFFIQRPVDQEAITFLKEGRQLNRNLRDIDYSASARRASRDVQRSVFNLTIGNDENSDRTRFVINADAQLNYEIGCDASKFMSGNAAVQLYTIEQGLRYAINERPLGSGEILLGATFATRGTYTITLSTKVENEVWLIDHLTGEETLLGENGYTFESEAGVYDNRFAIRLGNGDVTGIKNVGTSAKGEHEYYNLNGMRVGQPSKGLYIVNGKKVVVK